MSRRTEQMDVIDLTEDETADVPDVGTEKPDSENNDSDDNSSPKRKRVSKKTTRVSTSSDEDSDLEVVNNSRNRKRRRISSSQSSETDDDANNSHSPSPPWLQRKTNNNTTVKKNRVKVEDDDEVDLGKAKTARDQLKEIKRRNNVRRLESESSPSPPLSNSPDVPQMEEDQRSRSPSPVANRPPKYHKPTRSQLKQKCLDFFNTSTRAELLKKPRINEAQADLICDLRPFRNFYKLETEFDDTKGLRGELIDYYMEFLEMQCKLDHTLSECQRHGYDIQQAVSDLKRRKQKVYRGLIAPTHTLRDYQEIGLQWLILMHEKGLNSILADEMGLGKTIQIIVFLAHLKQKNGKGPHLIVVPSSTYENWYKELHTWWPEVRVLGYYGSQPERQQLRGEKPTTYDVILTTYPVISSTPDDRKYIKNIRIQYSIYDEAHMLKNCKTKRYKDLVKIRSEAKILLTGTPLQNDLVELMSLICFVMPDLFDHTDTNIISQHFKGDGKRSEYEREKIEQAKQILTPFILRRLKSDVLRDELPGKSEEVVHCEMPETQKELYEMKKEEYQELKDDPDAPAHNILMGLRKVGNHPLLVRNVYTDTKLEEIAPFLLLEKKYKNWTMDDLVDEFGWKDDFRIHSELKKFPRMKDFLLDDDHFLISGKLKKLDELLPQYKKRGKKVLLFSQFTMILDILEVYLNVNDHKFLRIDGGTNVLDRQTLIDEFNGSEDSFVFLLSTKAGGLGINLTGASVVILHDIDFNPHNDKQAEDRAHRVGQTENVHVVKLISKDTVEEYMYTCAKRKLELEFHVVANGLSDKAQDEKTVESLLKQALQ